MCARTRTTKPRRGTPSRTTLVCAQNAELFTLTYGTIVTQLIRDYEDPREVNLQLEQMCVRRDGTGRAAGLARTGLARERAWCALVHNHGYARPRVWSTARRHCLPRSLSHT